MQFLALLKRKTDGVTDEQVTPFLEPEAERARELYTQGIIRAIYGRGDAKGAVIQLECASLEEAKDALATLPFSQQKFIDVDVIPLLPYRGFAPRNK